MSSRGRQPRRVVRVAAVAVVTGLLTSCFGGGDEAAPEAVAPGSADAPSAAAAEQSTPVPSPSPAPAPTEGTCRRITARDLRTIVNDDGAVPCRRRHTAVTFHVGRLPREATRDARSAGAARVENAADRVCDRRFREYVGGDRVDRRLSMLTPSYFLPSQEQFALGARWVRCDVHAYATPTKLAALPRRLENALERERIRSDFARCSGVSPSHPRFRHLICARSHRWRAVDTVVLGSRGEQFPGRDTVEARARERCEERVRDYLGTQDGFSYGFEVPQRSAWADGDHVGYCWARTGE